MSAVEPAELVDEDEKLSPFMMAYTAPDQDSVVLLDGRSREFVSPEMVIPGDLVRDQGRLKQVRRVVESGDGSSVYFWFIEGTPGHAVLEHPGRPDAVVWRLVSGCCDDAG
jgi:hypothetical protein